MVEIIGWLGLVMLAVKLLEIGSSNEHRGPDTEIEKRPINTFAALAMAVGWIGLFAIAFMLVSQRQALSDGLAVAGGAVEQSRIDCITNAATNEEVIACAN